MRKLVQAALAITAGVLFSAGANAACDPGKPGSELTGAEAQNVYECMADKLHSGYKKGGKAG